MLAVFAECISTQLKTFINGCKNFHIVSIDFNQGLDTMIAHVNRSGLFRPYPVAG